MQQSQQQPVRKLRIVLFDYVFERDKPGASGLSDIVWNWSYHLIEQGQDVHIVAPYTSETKIPKGVVFHRMEIPRWFYRNVVGHLLLIYSGWRLIRSIPAVDVVQAPEYLSTAVFSLMLKHPHIVLIVPGNIYERIQHGNPFDWTMTTVLKIAAAISARHCVRVVATTDDMRLWWVRTGTHPTKIVVIPYGVNTHLFAPVANARIQLGIPSNQYSIVYVGRLSHEKGVATLLQAMHAVIQHVPTAHLHVIGEGPQYTALVEQAQILGIADHITWHGWIHQHDLPRYYSAAHITVLPSLSEGLPRTMLEALACGSPFIGSAITGIDECITHEKTGILVPPNNADALAHSILRLLQDPAFAQFLGQNARTFVVQHHSWAAIVQRIQEEVYAPLFNLSH